MNLRYKRLVAVFSVLVMCLVTVSVTLTADMDSDASPSFSYTISTSGQVVSGAYSPIGSSSSGKYTSSDGSNVGSWGFDSKGYGPFNSFYAAFDPTQNNKMICHLNPNDLMKSVDGVSISGKGYNIMWCLPTVYWSTDSSGNLILSNDPSKGTAFAHTIDGKIYKYIGIGVYEASTMSVNSMTILTSTSGDTPLVSQTRAIFRDYANNQSVNTAGTGNNGYAMVWNFYQWELYKYCALAVMGSWDSQSVAGNGSSYGESPYYDTPGLLNTSGPYAGTRGSVTNTTYTQDPVKVFIENAWGSVYDFVDGIVINGESGYTIDQSSVPSDSTSTTSSGYITYVGVPLPSSGYGSSPSTNVNVWGMPTANGGSETSGLYDYIYTSLSSSRVLYVGGFSPPISSTAPFSGLSCAHAGDVLSTSASTVGGRLAFVFDADPESTTTVTLDHSNLTDAGGDATGFKTSIDIIDGATYPDLNTVTSNPSIQAGWTHIGWEVDGVKYDIGSSLASTESHTAYSLWLPPQITITFMVEGKIHSTLQVPKGSVGVVYTPVMVEGIFAGWYYDDQFQRKYDATVPLDTDTTLHALGVPPLVFTSEPNAAANIQQVNSYGMFFFDATDSSGRYQIHWDFGDGNTSDEAIAYNTYSDPGLYTVTLTVTNIYGESATSTYEIDLRDGSATNDIKWFAIGALCVIAVGFVVRRIL